MYTLHQQCRACKNSELKPVFDLGPMPLANDYRTEFEEQAGFAPLQVLFCSRCRLSQLSVVVHPSLLYSKYSYRTSNSQTMAEHFKNLFEDLAKEVHLNRVVEIGSNDGLLLNCFKQSGTRDVLGIDPAANLVQIANQNGINSVCSCFNSDVVETTCRKWGIPDCIIARHVFCHIDDWQTLIKNLESISGPETIIYIEAPYIADTLKQVELDQIYHEHLSYLSLSALERVIETAKLNYQVDSMNLRLSKVRHYPIHGGVIGIVLKRNCTSTDGASIRTLIDSELQSVSLEQWRNFSIKAQINIQTLFSLVKHLRNQGKSIAGYGATAKSAAWINSCRFSKDDIQYVIDTTPEKQGKLCPGTKIPILEASIAKIRPPDYFILFAWNYQDEILGKEQDFIRRGGKFIQLIPEIKIL